MINEVFKKGYTHEGIIQYTKILKRKGYNKEEILQKIWIEKDLIVQEWENINEEREKENLKEKIEGILRAGLGKKDENQKWNTYVSYKRIIYWIRYNMEGEIVNELRKEGMFVEEIENRYSLCGMKESMYVIKLNMSIMGKKLNEIEYKHPEGVSNRIWRELGFPTEEDRKERAMELKTVIVRNDIARHVGEIYRKKEGNIGVRKRVFLDQKEWEGVLEDFAQMNKTGFAVKMNKRMETMYDMLEQWYDKKEVIDQERVKMFHDCIEEAYFENPLEEWSKVEARNMLRKKIEENYRVNEERFFKERNLVLTMGEQDRVFEELRRNSNGI